MQKVKALQALLAGNAAYGRYYCEQTSDEFSFPSWAGNSGAALHVFIETPEVPSSSPTPLPPRKCAQHATTMPSLASSSSTEQYASRGAFGSAPPPPP